MDAIETYLSEQKNQFEEALCELLRIPSVSADSRFAPDVRRAADWVAARLQSMDMDVEVIPTGGHPIVYGQWLKAGPNAPTVLVYGHYDVQPPDPLDQWKTPPFEPDRRDGNVYARGATDDKGQMLTHLFSAEAWMKTKGRLPVNIKYLIEGEEEVGSYHLDTFLENNLERLACDCVVISDTAQFAKDVPAITYGLRGISYYEIELRGPRQDLHSGVFGGAVTNPGIALSKLLAAMIDDQGRIQVPGFYDDVVPLSETERQKLAELPFDEAAFAKSIDVDGLAGETGFTTLERRWARPTFDVHGLTCGYQGEGAKTILPGVARAKFSFRLVANQDAVTIESSLRSFLEKRLPPGIRMTLTHLPGWAPGVVVPLESPYLKAAEKAIAAGFGKPPVFIREGGSIPVVATFAEKLGADTLLLGWGLNDDNLHGPNEKFSLRDFHRGIRSSAHLWNELAELPKQ